MWIASFFSLGGLNSWKLQEVHIFVRGRAGHSYSEPENQKAKGVWLPPPENLDNP